MFERASEVMNELKVWEEVEEDSHHENIDLIDGIT